MAKPESPPPAVSNTRHIRIIHIITSLDTGGAEMMLLRLAERLQEHFDQQVICLTNPGIVAQRLQAIGVQVTSLEMSSAWPNPWAIVKLAWLIRRFRPQVVQTWLYHADLLGGIATYLAGMRALAWNIRNNDLSADKTKPNTRRVVALCAKLSHWLPKRIVCCSQNAMQTHIALGYAQDAFVVIPNGFDLQLFKPDPSARHSVRVELGIPADAPVIGLIARFDPQKNHAGFFEAAYQLHKQRPDVHFLLVGRGIDASNPLMISWMHDAGVSKITRLLGERYDIPRLTATLDIATSTSSWGEAFPNVLGEAMACGVPCVSTDAGDASWIVGDTGRIVPRDDMTALAQAWDTLLGLADNELAMLSEQARARITDTFEIGNIAVQYAKLYQELAIGHKQCAA
ncbi:MAG: glycosyltransferase [Methylophilaceae bacterium]